MLKRAISIMVLLLFILSAIPQVVFAGSEKQYNSPELQRAVDLGIGVYTKNKSITYKNFFKMLDVAVKISDSAKLTKWKSQFKKSRSSNKMMTRQEGMLALFYAAETLGEEYLYYNADPDWSVTHKRIGDKCWDELKWDYPLITGWDKPTKLVNEWSDHMVAAYFYSFGRESIYSGKTIFDLDSKSVSMRLNDKLTYDEGMLAALRLHDSNLKPQERIQTQEDKKLLARKDDQLKKIQSYKAELTVAGTSYYISNTGNDYNDGLSPETAWATLYKVNTTAMKSGDGVFFECGGLWRYEPWPSNASHCGDGVLYAQKGVTYSSYGVGDKPKIYGSPENGADPSKWELLKGTDNIWVFYKDIQDCGGIILNDDSLAYKTCAFWDGKEYYKSSDGVRVDSPRVPFRVKSLNNLYFFNEIYYPGKEAAGHFSLVGKLYLRCDEGNPGSIYSSIEFQTGNNDWNQGFASAPDGCVFDNLCLLYGASGITLRNNSIVRNCEIGWIGGQILDYSGVSLGDNTKGLIVRCGDAILCFGNNNTIINNYVHDIYDYGISIEGFAANPSVEEWKRENNTIGGNIVERCYGSIIIVDWYAMNKNLKLKSFKNIQIKDNYFMYSGYGWSHQNMEDTTGNIALFFHKDSINNITISNNVFYLSRNSLIKLVSASDNKVPTLSGNTYVQNDFYVLIDRSIGPVGKHKNYTYNPYTLKKTITDVLGDKTASVFD